MKSPQFIPSLAIFATLLCLGEPLSNCKQAPVPAPTEWITMVDSCTQKMRDQVQVELTAAMTYLAMGAHFSQDRVNRPGFAKMFFEAASEERQHAMKIMEYLLMRGALISNLANLIENPVPKGVKWDNGLHALKSALELETSVTNNILDIMKECETPSGVDKTNDYHLVDYLTADFLEEQYRGQKDLANKISTLGKMVKSHGTIGEFLFDKKILNGELIHG